MTLQKEEGQQVTTISSSLRHFRYKKEGFTPGSAAAAAPATVGAFDCL